MATVYVTSAGLPELRAAHTVVECKRSSTPHFRNSSWARGSILPARFPIFSRHANVQKACALRNTVKVVAAAAGVVDEPASKTSTAFERFDWGSNWYPVSIIADLDPTAPTQFTLLNLPLVLWKSKTGWRAFEDKCPHRLAPLSEGRIDQSGDLMCSYHGWTFRGDGSCSNVPQLPEKDRHLADKPSACTVALPVREHQGMLWVWPDASTREKAEATSPPTLPALDQGLCSFNGQRDIAYGYDTLVENVVDPSHVPFAHHGIQGNRSKPGINALKLLENSISGFKVLREPESEKMGYSDISWQAPCLVTYNVELKIKGAPPGPWPYLTAYLVPRTPTTARIIFFFPQWMKFVALIHKLKPRWIDHFERNDILDGDMVFLNRQERILREQGSGAADKDRTAAEVNAELSSSFFKQAYMPARADVAVNSFRVWMQRHAPEGVKWLKGDGHLGPSPPKEQLLDRFHQVGCQGDRTETIPNPKPSQSCSAL
eukprot:jgi/Mesvir1/12819/Mv04890-RA.2